MTTIHVEVTQDDIDTGIGGSAADCPVQLAIRRDPWYPTKSHVLVGRNVMSYRDGTLYRIRKLPTDVQKFINDFDNGRPVQPITFDIEVAR